MYGHYLRKKNENMSKHCVSITILQRDHADFYDELEKRWQKLQEKRGNSTQDLATNKKRKQALAGTGESFSNVADDSMLKSAAEHTAMTPIAWALLSSEKKAEIRDERCQAAWDLAFVCCGIAFNAADHPLFRNAIARTKECPDFKIACAKTMGTTHA